MGAPSASHNGSTTVAQSAASAANVASSSGTLSIVWPRIADSFQVLPHSTRSRYFRRRPQAASRSTRAFMGEASAEVEQYERLVSEMPVGKRLPDAVYIHVDALPTLPHALSRI